MAAHLLEAAEADIEFADGVFRVAGTDRGDGIEELAPAQLCAGALPMGAGPWPLRPADEPSRRRHLPQRLPHLRGGGRPGDRGDVTLVLRRRRRRRHGHQSAAGQGADPWRHRPGRRPGLRARRCVYDRRRTDPDRKLHGLRHAARRRPSAPCGDRATRCRPATNPLGAKGAGEAGTVGALPALLGAVVDALRPLGVTHLDMPATPERVWAAIREAQADEVNAAS